MKRSNSEPTPVAARSAVETGHGNGPATAAASGLQRLAFVVPGDPVPKGRPRFGLRKNTYTPRRTVEAEARIVQYLKVAYPHLKPSPNDFHVSLVFRFKGVGRGDWDNYAKLVCDALNGLVWEDDHQVRAASVHLLSDSDQPQTEVTIVERMP